MFNNALYTSVTMWKYYDNLYVLSNPLVKHEGNKKIHDQIYSGKWFLVMQRSGTFIPRWKIWKLIYCFSYTYSFPPLPTLKQNVCLQLILTEDYNLNIFMAFEFCCLMLPWCRKWNGEHFSGVWIMLIMRMDV